MADPVKYKKPRKINPVSVTIVGVLGVLGLMAWEYAPLVILKSEAYRVLESYGSKISGRSSYYLDDPIARNSLRLKMESELRLAGVNDRDMETWIEVDGSEVSLGVVYSKFIDWPFDIVSRTEELYEIEHTMLMD